MKVFVGIPARMGASRFPGKPLCKILGMSMIEHVHKRASLAQNVDGVFFAVCDQVVKDEVENFGGTAYMTPVDIERPALRVAYACDSLPIDDDDIVVVVQGDEPLVNPGMISLAIAPLIKDRNILLGTLVAYASPEEWVDENEVKVVVDTKDDILFMTRSPVPSKTRNEIGPRLKQVAIMPFRKSFLQKFQHMSMTPYEYVESIELLRAVEHGYKVRAIYSDYQSISVDTESDRQEVEAAMINDVLYRAYKR